MDGSPKILIVDDEQDLREILEFNLGSEGFITETASSAEEALQLSLERYDLILLDIMMGGMSGFKMADILRKERKLSTPIIFLTARSAENDLLTGFNVGADDYIAKPFSIKEVIVRIRAVLKRGNAVPSQPEILKIKKLQLNQDRKSISIDNKDIELTRKEFGILLKLMKNQGKYISREEILREVWSDTVIVTDRNVDVTITRLRKKMEDYGSFIKGKTGYGYCINDA